jgi:thiamine-phosphate pyrophosphorylase
MSMDTGAFRLYLITDRKTVPQGRTLLQCVEQALCGGVRAVQLRDKDLPADELYRCGLALRSLTARFGARLLVNDRIDVALATGADGVHLGEHSLPTAEARRLLGQNAIIGRSVHHPEAIHPAAQEGATAVRLRLQSAAGTGAGWHPAGSHPGGACRRGGRRGAHFGDSGRRQPRSRNTGPAGRNG